MIDRDAPQPLYLQIQKVLHDQIRTGVYPPRSRVPSEQELATQYGVSRMTARKSLDALVTQGLLFRRPGKGTFVTDDILSYGLSTTLSFSRTLRARGYAVETEVLRQEIISGPPPVVERLHLSPGSKVLIVHRLRWVAGEPAAIHASYLDGHIFAPLLGVDLETGSLLEAIEHIGGVRMAYTRDTVQAALTSAEQSRLLQVSAGDPVLQVEGTTYDQRSRPVRFTRAIYRGDKFKLVIKSTFERTSALVVVDNGL
jgi:GntR family transcriptional regulator